MITIKNNFKEKNILKIVPGVTKIPELVDLSKLGDNYRLGYLERETVGEDYDDIIYSIIVDASDFNWYNDPDWTIQSNGFLDNYFNSFLELKKSIELGEQISLTEFFKEYEKENIKEEISKLHQEIGLWIL